MTILFYAAVEPNPKQARKCKADANFDVLFSVMIERTSVYVLYVLHRSC